MERDTSRLEGNVESAGSAEVRRGMIMARDVGTTHPEMLESRQLIQSPELMGHQLIEWGSIWGASFVYLSLAAVLGGFAVSAGVLANVGPVNQTETGIGIAVTAVIAFISAICAGIVGGWTSNLRSYWPTLVNGLVLGAFITTAPMLFLMAVSSFAAGTAGAAAANQATNNLPMFGTGTLSTIGANLGWFSLSVLLTWGLCAYGYVLGVNRHLADLNIPNAMLGRRRRVRA